MVYKRIIKPFYGVSIQHGENTLKLWSEQINNHSCNVEMIQSFVGSLTISRGNKIIFDTPVDLDFNADTSDNLNDIQDWKKMCVDYMTHNRIPNLVVV